MPKSETTRTYIFADADLKQKADALAQTIDRDMAQFATRNITKVHLTNFRNLIDDFDNCSTDEELLGMVSVATERKDAAAAVLRPQLRTIRNTAETAYGGSGMYNLFGFGPIADAPDNDLCQLAKRVHRVATRLLPELAVQGLTQAQLDTLQSGYKELDALLDKCAEAEEERDIEAQGRITKGNTLYAEMVRLAGIGKSLFEDTDEARYNDYVLIGAHSSPAKPADDAHAA